MIAAAASWSRGAGYVAAEHETAEPGLTAADAAAADAQRTAADG